MAKMELLTQIHANTDIIAKLPPSISSPFDQLFILKQVGFSQIYQPISFWSTIPLVGNFLHRQAAYEANFNLFLNIKIKKMVIEFGKANN